MAETTQLELVTPAGIMVQQAAEMVVAPGVEGLFGVLPRHAPLLADLERDASEDTNGQQFGLPGPFNPYGAVQCPCAVALPSFKGTLALARLVFGAGPSTCKNLCTQRHALRLSSHLSRPLS